LTDDWIVDFGAYMLMEEAALYEKPFEYVLQHFKPVRDEQRDVRRQTMWWIHGSPASNLRQATEKLDRFLVTPRVSRHRLFIWLPSHVYPDNRLNVFARADEYFFGVLHSRVHEVWSMRTVSRHGIGNDPTYNNTSCFETFPLPWSPGTEPVSDPSVIAIGDAAAKLDRLRRNWLDPEGATEAELKKRTLTNLYNARPQWLRNAHAALDRAVWDAYGWDDPDPATVEEDTILSRLLALNLERTNTGLVAYKGPNVVR
jgi:type II restriction/modification system DNA methylase subunit YeeA